MRFSRHAKNLGFPVHFRDLRASHSAALLDRGGPVHVVAKRIGDDPATLPRFYARAHQEGRCQSCRSDCSAIEGRPSGFGSFFPDFGSLFLIRSLTLTRTNPPGGLGLFFLSAVCQSWSPKRWSAPDTCSPAGRHCGRRRPACSRYGLGNWFVDNESIAHAFALLASPSHAPV
jgi:hypothetical protein